MKVAFKNAFLVAAYACLVFSCTRSSVSEGEIRAKFSQLELGEDKAGLLRTYHQVKKDGDCDSDIRPPCGWLRNGMSAKFMPK